MDDKRTEVEANDIPDIEARFANLEAEADHSRTEQSFMVPVDEIREHGYDLAFNTYKETVREVVNYEAPEVILDRVATLADKIVKGVADLQTLIANNHEA